MVDDDPTPEELAEAAALARALETGSARSTSPSDALETAGLLRYAEDVRQLDAERQAAILDRALAEARPQPVPTVAPWERLRWLWAAAAGSVAAAAALAVHLQVSHDGELRDRDGERTLPSPPMALLETQAAAASGRASLDELALSMRGYRSSVYEDLKHHYAR